MAAHIDNIIKDLNKAKFIVLIDDSKKCMKGSLTLRANISSKEEADEFMHQLSTVTNTNWIVHYDVASPQRMVFHKAWLCQHSSHNKSKQNKTERNTGCGAAIDIKIKFNTCNTRRTDKYLKLSPPLCAVVRFRYEHNHDTHTSTVTRFLKVSPEAISTFEEYFNNGLPMSEAISIHETKLLLRDGYSALANAAQNPTRRQVQTIHDNWRKQHLESFQSPTDDTVNIHNTSESGTNTSELVVKSEPTTTEVEIKEEIDEVGDYIKIKMEEYLHNLPINLKNELSNCMQKINSQEQFNSFIATAVATNINSCTVRVQSPSIAKTFSDVTNASKRTAAVRPSYNLKKIKFKHEKEI